MTGMYYSCHAWVLKVLGVSIKSKTSKSTSQLARLPNAPKAHLRISSKSALFNQNFDSKKCLNPLPSLNRGFSEPARNGVSVNQLWGLRASMRRDVAMGPCLSSAVSMVPISFRMRLNTSHITKDASILSSIEIYSSGHGTFMAL